MALFLNEQEVVQLLPMAECVDVLDEAFSHAGAGKVDIKPRSRIRMPRRLLSLHGRRRCRPPGFLVTRPTRLLLVAPR